MGKNILSTHVLVESYPDSEGVLQRIQAVLKNDFGIYFSTVQIESEICPDIEEAEEIDFLRQAATPDAQAESHH